MRERILNIIEKNAKLSTEDLAALLGEDKERVAEEVSAMEKAGTICGYMLFCIGIIQRMNEWTLSSKLRLPRNGAWALTI